MQVGIVGAGAIGLWVAAKLAAAGEQVSVLARGSATRALAQGGAVLLPHRRGSPGTLFFAPSPTCTGRGENQ